MSVCFFDLIRAIRMPFASLVSLHMIIAHRGHHLENPENSLAAFRAAIAVGADAIECDVRLTADQVAIVAHYDKNRVGGQEIMLSQTSWDEIDQLRRSPETEIPNLDELFDFVFQSGVTAFIEVKQNNPILAAQIASRIEKFNLWDKIHILGFAARIGSSLKLQVKYPKLRVVQLLMLPMLARINGPRPSYGLAIGWLERFMAQTFFKSFYPDWKLKRFSQYFKNRGFRLFAGVTNERPNFEYFYNAGIADIFTDNLVDAVNFAKSKERGII